MMGWTAPAPGATLGTGHRCDEERGERSALTVTTIGLDLTKQHVFQVHGADAEGCPAIRRKPRRNHVLMFFAGLEPCLVGMEACAGYIDADQLVASTREHGVALLRPTPKDQQWQAKADEGFTVHDFTLD